MQNADGGWPTFCRGWGTLPFDRSGADLTAHAIRALGAWRVFGPPKRVDAAIQRGFDYLAGEQQPDGSWVPLWFGGQYHPSEQNPVYGTGRVLLAYRGLGRLGDQPARRGLSWLAASRCPDGGWDAAEAAVSTTEETAIEVEALLAAHTDPALQGALADGLRWLVTAVAEGRHREAAPIGFYFAKLWYYERMYPLTFTVSALGRAIHRLAPNAPSAAEGE